jgi:hypothetical protein
MKSHIFWDIRRIVRWKPTDVSEEHIAFIFRFKERGKQETSVKAGGRQSQMTLEMKSFRYISDDLSQFAAIRFVLCNFIGPGDMFLCYSPFITNPPP